MLVYLAFAFCFMMLSFTAIFNQKVFVKTLEYTSSIS